MSSFPQSYDEELAVRLEELSRPENQGEGLHARDFVVLALVTIVVPLVALAMGWTL